MTRHYGHGPAVAAELAAWLPSAWAEVYADVAAEQVSA